MSDFHVIPVGGGSYDKELVETNGILDFVMVGDNEETHRLEVQQRIVYAVGTWLGESPFDRSKGFPWEQSVFGKQPVEGIVVFLYDTIVGVDGVANLAEPPVIEVDNATRQATIVVQAEGEDFVIDLQQIVQAPT